MTSSTTAAERYRAQVRGCLLGGAVGDALGAPMEFSGLTDIRAMYGEPGVREYAVVPGSGGTYGQVTDDTQMTLFTVEGLIRAGVRRDRGIGFTVSVVHHAYDRWLDTQLYSEPTGKRDGWLQGEGWLYERRAPGTTCLAALDTARKGNDAIPQFGWQADNRSKGCGAVNAQCPIRVDAQHIRRKWTHRIRHGG